MAAAAGRSRRPVAVARAELKGLTLAFSYGGDFGPVGAGRRGPPQAGVQQPDRQRAEVHRRGLRRGARSAPDRDDQLRASGRGGARQRRRRSRRPAAEHLQPFSQTEVGRSQGGAGLGLSICREIVDPHGRRHHGAQQPRPGLQLLASRWCCSTCRPSPRASPATATTPVFEPAAAHPDRRRQRHQPLGGRDAGRDVRLHPRLRRGRRGGRSRRCATGGLRPGADGHPHAGHGRGRGDPRDPQRWRGRRRGADPGAHRQRRSLGRRPATSPRAWTAWSRKPIKAELLAGRPSRRRWRRRERRPEGASRPSRACRRSR